MTTNYWLSILVGALIFAAAVPYVARIRHPTQKPLAAYLIFVTVFVAAAAVFFNLLVVLANRLGVAQMLGEPGPAFGFLVLVMLPAVAIATWLARKPPWRRGPPT